jgi:hypothetical protein
VTRPQHVAFAGLLLFVLLAVVHVPMVTIEEDSIGLFDLAVVGFGILLLASGARLGAGPEARPILCLYLAFLGYVTLGYLLGTLASDFGFFSTALLVKQYEYLLIVLVAGYLVVNVPRRNLLVPLCLTLYIVSLAGVYFLLRSDYKRLGLLFQEGHPVNPAAFILATTMLLLICDAGTFLEGRGRIGKLWFLGALGAGFAALILTFSRTNSLAFIIAVAFFLLQRNRGAFLIGMVMLVGVLIALPLVTERLGLKVYGGELFTSFLVDPLSIFQEHTFQTRLNRNWLLGYDQWVANPLTILFGIGFGRVRLTDGLVPHLLYSTGLVGLALYVTMLGWLFVRGTAAMRTIVLFVLINSVSAETTINSFRAMQVFLVPLAYLVNYHLRPAALRRAAAPQGFALERP